MPMPDGEVGLTKLTSIQLRSLIALTSIAPPAPGSLSVAVAPWIVKARSITSFATPGTVLPLAEYVDLAAAGLLVQLRIALPQPARPRGGPRPGQADKPPNAVVGGGRQPGHRRRGRARCSAFLSSRVLGQFDPFRDGRRRRGAAGCCSWRRTSSPSSASSTSTRTDFRLWVCLHEETHRVQFAAVAVAAGPHAGRDRRARRPTDVDARPVRAGCATALEDSSAASGARAARAARCSTCSRPRSSARSSTALTAVMTLLEGHADVVMDAVGPAVVPTRRRPSGSGSTPAARAAATLEKLIRRLLGLDAKMRQYSDGAEFVRGSRRRGRHGGFNAVWTAPDNLPTAAEIPDPRAVGRAACTADAPARLAGGARDPAPSAARSAPRVATRAGRPRPGYPVVLVACSGGAGLAGARRRRRVRRPPRAGLARPGAVVVDHRLQAGSAEVAAAAAAALRGLGLDAGAVVRGRRRRRRRARGGRPRRPLRRARAAADEPAPTPCCSATPSTTRPRPVLLGLARGSGTALARRHAPRPRPLLRRPLLGLRRADTRAVCAAHGPGAVARPAQHRPRLRARPGPRRGAAGARGRARPGRRRGARPHRRPAARRRRRTSTTLADDASSPALEPAGRRHVSRRRALRTSPACAGASPRPLAPAAVGVALLAARAARGTRRPARRARWSPTGTAQGSGSTLPGASVGARGAAGCRQLVLPASGRRSRAPASTQEPLVDSTTSRPTSSTFSSPRSRSSDGSPSSPRRSTRTTRASDLLLVGVLKGAVMVMADLARALHTHVDDGLDGGLVVRLRHQVHRRGADPQGPRHRPHRPARADRRGHHRLRPHPVLAARQPASPAARVGRDLRAAAQARGRQGRDRRQVRRLRHPQRVRRRLRPGLRREVPQPARSSAPSRRTSTPELRSAERPPAGEQPRADRC